MEGSSNSQWTSSNYLSQFFWK
ncbi:MAG TPA: hypothetical protein DDY52_05070 [Candidatus Moranbacteria bacterium]|nr:hypothetical protein [Candidatus Moranbacteria bacterium]